MRGVNVRPGDEVILAAYDFEANFKNVLAIGATPVLVDVRADDAQLDVDQVDLAGSDRVRAVLASHLHGGVVDVVGLRELCDRRGWGFVEDVAQMPGATIRGRAAGSWGDVGVLSFGGSKLLTAGRGGCVLTDRNDVLQRIRLHVQRGNDLSPLSELQAALLLPQLERLEDRNAARFVNVERLRKLFNGVPGLDFLSQASGGCQFSEIGCPPKHATSQGNETARSLTIPGYYKVGFWYDPAAFADLTREQFAAAMRAEGIALWPGFRGLHRIHSRKRYRAIGDLKNAAAADQRLLVLHHPVLLETGTAMELIAEAVQRIRRFAPAIRDVDPSVA